MAIFIELVSNQNVFLVSIWTWSVVKTGQISGSLLIIVLVDVAFNFSLVNLFMHI